MFEKFAVFPAQVYLYLLKMYLSPPDPKSLGVIASYSSPTEPQQDAALDLLEEHASQIDTARVRVSFTSTLRCSRILQWKHDPRLLLRTDALIKRTLRQKRIPVLGFGTSPSQHESSWCFGLPGKCSWREGHCQARKPSLAKSSICWAPASR